MREEPAPGSRPRAYADDEVVPTRDLLAWQRDHVRDRGAEVAALSLDAAIDDVDSGGALAGLLAPTARFGDLPGLRVMAAVHRLALERRAPAVALHLPTLGGTPPRGQAARDDFRSAVVAALVDHPDVLSRSLAQTPQTNETGRAPLLRAALSRLPPNLPVRLREIGASAGLNLRADRLPGVAVLEAGPLPPIADRVGCDLHPIDPTSQEGRLALSSYIWVDDVARFQRLGRALAVANEVPAIVVEQDAADFVESLVLMEGTTTVLWHSAFWVYLPAETRIRVLAAVDALGATAGDRRRLALASWEWDGEVGDAPAAFALTMRQWTGRPSDGRSRIIARGDSHGGSERLAGPD